MYPEIKDFMSRNKTHKQVQDVRLKLMENPMWNEKKLNQVQIGKTSNGRECVFLLSIKINQK